MCKEFKVFFLNYFIFYKNFNLYVNFTFNDFSYLFQRNYAVYFIISLDF